MGEQRCWGEATGKNITEAWERAYKEDEEYYGHQEGYSGHLNVCRFIGDVTSQYKRMSEDEFEAFLERKLDRGEAVGVCTKEPVKNNNKIKTKVENIPQKGARKWVTMYIAETLTGEILVKANTQTECIKRARKIMEQQSVQRVKITIHKELLSGNKHCATITYKKSAKESDGKYYFFGLARC
jgi:hypothetical protein